MNGNSSISVKSCWLGRKISSRNRARPLAHLQSETENHPDLADRASSETDRALELRTRDRQRKLISKIEERPAPHRGRLLRLLRGDRRADQPGPAGSPPDRHPEPRGPGAPRAPRTRPPRRLTSTPSSQALCRERARSGGGVRAPPPRSSAPPARMGSTTRRMAAVSASWSDAAPRRSDASGLASARQEGCLP